ncbi:hypothetical protein [Helicobacter canis]|uniref:Uncharacterized protein n=1 Tax=Helicobacter canis TaxID=29419 RepID=A0A377J181_9HELI|nr:hypothetical protein [Helicobacter canis]STO96220.1 Uncharacterised protein [Helicobacter canis]STO96285.1 Uncharacterised protein [Helicobacter canis]
MWKFSMDRHALQSKARDDNKKVDSSVFMDCHDFASAKSRNDRNLFFQQDSRSCGGAVGALQTLGKVSDLGDRAFHKVCNTAALPTQDRIYKGD